MTISDTSMQEQAFLTEQIWLELGKNTNYKSSYIIKELVKNMWKENYSSSILSMTEAVDALKNNNELKIRGKIIDIIYSIVESKLNILDALEKDYSILLNDYESGKKQIKQSDFNSGFQTILETYFDANMIINGNSISKKSPVNSDESSKIMSIEIITILSIILIGIIFILKRKS